jgi:hypothetical protein
MLATPPPVTIAVWEKMMWFGGCQFEGLNGVFLGIDVCLCESAVVLLGMREVCVGDDSKVGSMVILV